MSSVIALSGELGSQRHGLIIMLHQLERVKTSIFSTIQSIPLSFTTSIAFTDDQQVDHLIPWPNDLESSFNLTAHRINLENHQIYPVLNQNFQEALNFSRILPADVPVKTKDQTQAVYDELIRTQFVQLLQHMTPLGIFLLELETGINRLSEHRYPDSIFPVESWFNVIFPKSSFNQTLMLIIQQLVQTLPLTTVRRTECTWTGSALTASRVQFNPCFLDMVTIIPDLSSSHALHQLTIEAQPFVEETSKPPFIWKRVTLPKADHIFMLQNTPPRFVRIEQMPECLKTSTALQCQLCFSRHSVIPIQDPCLDQILRGTLQPHVCTIEEVNDVTEDITIDRSNQVTIIDNTPGRLDVNCPHQPKNEIQLQPAVKLTFDPKCHYQLHGGPRISEIPHAPGLKLTNIPERIPLPKVKEVIEAFPTVLDHFKNNWYIYAAIIGFVTIIVLLVCSVYVTCYFRRKLKKHQRRRRNRRRQEQFSETDNILPNRFNLISLPSLPTWTRTSRGLEISEM
jgi:hypothetical protein